MIINLTQHPATQQQIDAGVVDLEGSDLGMLIELLTFTSLPSPVDVESRAEGLALIMMKFDPDLTNEVSFMVGGAPYLMAELKGYAPVYKLVFAYSERVSNEVVNNEGVVVKTNLFKHLGFVPMSASM